MESKIDTYKITDLRSELCYEAYPEELFTFGCTEPEYRIIQGSVFDGKTYYVAVNAMKDGQESTKILVMDKAGVILRESPVLLLDHANAMSFSPENKLFVTHCQSPDEHYNRYSLVDPETFEIIKTADLEKPFFAMAYCPKTERFGSGQWSGQTLNVWDKELNLLKNADVEKPLSLSQGVCCNENGLFFIRSDKDGAPSEIRHYSWELELVRSVKANFKEGVEAEDISIADGEVYVVANDSLEKCGVAYKMHFKAI